MELISEFPFTGTIKTFTENPLGDDLESVVYSGKMDLKVSTPEIGVVAQEANYLAYLPISKVNGAYVNPVKKGDKFSCNMYGEVVTGVVVNAMPSQLGRLTVYVNRELW
jgi:hypothetical protein